MFIVQDQRFLTQHVFYSLIQFFDAWYLVAPNHWYTLATKYKLWCITGWCLSHDHGAHVRVFLHINYKHSFSMQKIVQHSEFQEILTYSFLLILISRKNCSSNWQSITLLDVGPSFLASENFLFWRYCGIIQHMEWYASFWGATMQFVA